MKKKEKKAKMGSGISNTKKGETTIREHANNKSYQAETDAHSDDSYCFVNQVQIWEDGPYASQLLRKQCAR